jgi:hypothetical protein
MPRLAVVLRWVLAARKSFRRKAMLGPFDSPPTPRTEHTNTQGYGKTHVYGDGDHNARIRDKILPKVHGDGPPESDTKKISTFLGNPEERRTNLYGL